LRKAGKKEDHNESSAEEEKPKVEKGKGAVKGKGKKVED
jgi:hypothetical protein